MKTADTVFRRFQPAGYTTGAAVDTLTARADDGRWVVDCTTDGCEGAGLAGVSVRWSCKGCGAGPFDAEFPV